MSRGYTRVISWLLSVGDPVALLHHLGLGFWSFLADPAAGLVQSARGGGLAQFTAGLSSGTRALLSNIVFAFSNATAKMSGAIRKGLLVMGLEHPQRSGELLIKERG
jgi:Vacuolar-sorting-associated 13 protein C-terminal